VYAIVKFSTDMRDRNYKIEFTQSRAKALKALEKSIEYSYKDPEAAGNHHKDLYEAYEMPYGWRRPSKKVISEELYRRRGSIYSPNESGIVYNAIRKDGIELK